MDTKNGQECTANAVCHGILIVTIQSCRLATFRSYIAHTRQPYHGECTYMVLLQVRPAMRALLHVHDPRDSKMV